MSFSEILIAVVLGTGLIWIPYSVGYSRGRKAENKKIHELLHWKEGYIITSVSFEKWREE